MNEAVVGCGDQSMKQLFATHPELEDGLLIGRRRRTALSVSCPGLVFVRIFRKILSGVRPLSGFCQDFLSGVCLSGFCLSRFCPLSGFCPEFCKKSCPMSVCPDSVCLDSVRCPDFVRISGKNSVRCLSVRPDKDKTELSGFSLSLSADVCFGCDPSNQAGKWTFHQDL